MAAAVLEVLDFQPVVFKEQGNFFGPGLRAGEIAKKSPGTGTVLPGRAHDVLLIS
jgi:hypothetical protein